MTAARKRPVRAPQMTEADWQRRVIETAQWNGWTVVHFRPALTPTGDYLTHMDGDPGFPDLVLARDGVVLLRELKRDGENPTPGQRTWLAALGPHGGVWRPADWDLVLATLTAKRSAP